MSELLGGNGKLTRWEWHALAGAGINLADGHAHQSLTEGQLRVVQRLPLLFQEAAKRPQLDCETAFLDSYFKFARQEAFCDTSPSIFHYSSSQSIEVVATLISSLSEPTGIIYPTFDNIPAIFHRIGVRPVPLPETWFRDPTQTEPRLSSIFLVLPNNPTGALLTKEELLRLLQWCRTNGVLFIVDLSFRLYSPQPYFDIYALLVESGVDFICVEDTGKTWPTLDLKLGFVLCSPRLYRPLRSITDDCLLNVSPFIFLLLREFIEAEEPHAPSFRLIANQNRDILRASIRGLPLTPRTKGDSMSVEWLQVPQSLDATLLSRRLAQQFGVHVLPGSLFFWATPAMGRRFFRVALMRPRETVLAGARRLAAGVTYVLNS